MLNANGGVMKFPRLSRTAGGNFFVHMGMEMQFCDTMQLVPACPRLYIVIIEYINMYKDGR
ncbi:MAG: hypothetical protein C6W55_17760 [Thermobacillus sp.]|nr:MAG: hypothetical protein C6W55_17760 [Thermobacillus sp.]